MGKMGAILPARMIFMQKFLSKAFPASWTISWRHICLGLIGLGLCALAFGFASNPSRGQSEDPKAIFAELERFGEVFESIRYHYVEPVEAEELVRAAINGMLSALDPHSNFLSPEDLDQIQERTRGEFGGLGIEITMEDGFIKVIAPIDDTPAAEAGILSGDLIIGIDGETVLGLDLNEAVALMRGDIDSEVTVSVKRGEQPVFDITLTRAVIKMRSVRHESFGSVGYIRITTFSAQTTPGLKKAVRELKAEHGKNLTGLVLDLRNNPGGLLAEAIAVSDAFLERGEIVSTRGREPASAARFSARRGDLLDGLPIVVLINSGSASASEIVAGAFKDHGRALIMGTRSFGKGSVQSIITIRTNDTMRLTTARYYTPSGLSIQGTGITPDIVVEPARVEGIDGGEFREEDLKGALVNGDADANADAENTPPDENADETEAIQDYQLARAVDVLNAWRIWGK